MPPEDEEQGLPALEALNKAREVELEGEVAPPPESKPDNAPAHEPSPEPGAETEHDEIKETPEQIAERQATAAKAAEHRGRIERLIKEDDAFHSLGDWANAQRAAGVQTDTIVRLLHGMAARITLNFAAELATRVGNDVPAIMERHRKQQQAQAAQAERQRVANLSDVRRKKHRH
jgi:hypothetical protein